MTARPRSRRSPAPRASRRSVARRPIRVVSGGQTGVDRAALDAALECGIDIGGWCPRGRRAEDGPIDARYPLHETESGTYPERTFRNVRDSDATLILSSGPLKGGTRLTQTLAEQRSVPVLVVDRDAPTPEDAAGRIQRWIEETGLQVLNVAGPRESTRPGIYAWALEVLRVVFRE